MKKITVILLAVVCLCLLAGCSCKHEWVDATCEAPRTCSLCGETEGDVLAHDWIDATCEIPKTCRLCEKTDGEASGHSWQDATCEAPKTCAVCNASEGDAAGHSYGKWEIVGEAMSRACQSCSAQETMAVNREVYLHDQLMGRWDCTKLIMTSFDMELDAADEFKGAIPYMVIGKDNTLRFFNGRDYFDGSFAFTEYSAEDGMEYYSFYGMQDGVPQMEFALVISPEQECAIYGYERMYTLRYELESEDGAMMREALTGTWVSTPNRADGSKVDYRDCTVTFQDDHSFTLTLDGTTLEGNWYDPELRTTDEYDMYDYRIQYSDGSRRHWQFVHIIRYHDGITQCSINFDNEFELYFVKQ